MAGVLAAGVGQVCGRPEICSPHAGSCPRHLPSNPRRRRGGRRGSRGAEQLGRTGAMRNLQRRLKKLETYRQVKKPLRLVVRYVGLDGTSDRSDPPPAEDDSHEIIQIVVEYEDLPAKAPQGWAKQLAGPTFTGGRGPGLTTDIVRYRAPGTGQRATFQNGGFT